MTVRRNVYCSQCGKRTFNTYSRRGPDGREMILCYKCADKEVKMLVEKEKMAAWNAWAKHE